MILIEIIGEPVSWKAHGGYGKRAFSLTRHEKEKYQWQIRSQYNQLNPLGGPVRVHYCFHVPIPKATSRPRRAQMLNGVMHPIKRPDIDNYDKFLSDCLTGIVWEDDSQIVEKYSKKIYGEILKTIIRVEAING